MIKNFNDFEASLNEDTPNYKSENEHLSELENHVVRHFRDTREPIEDPHQGFLMEFSDGYKSKNPDGTYAYAMDPGDDKLIEDFIKIVEADNDGSYEYNSDDFKNIIIKAMEKFGL